MPDDATPPVLTPRPSTAPSGGPPGAVTAAVLITFFAAGGTAFSSAFLTGGFLLLGWPILDAFPDLDLLWILLASAGTVIALSAVAVVAAAQVLRGRRWARWLLAGLCPVAALGGLVAAYYVVPLGVSASAVAVLVLLFVPSTRTWFRHDHGTSVAGRSPGD